LDGGRGKDAVIARVRDISMDGIGVAVAQFVPRRYDFKIGETLYVSFTMEKKSGDVELHVEGTVRNIVPDKVSATYKIGLQFVGLDEDTRREIRLFLW
jgi:c-di-GMP-binding flagellar brake protein YcgR